MIFSIPIENHHSVNKNVYGKRSLAPNCNTLAYRKGNKKSITEKQTFSKCKNFCISDSEYKISSSTQLNYLPYIRCRFVERVMSSETKLTVLAHLNQTVKLALKN